jgi:CHAT domain-containing protein
MWNTTQLTSFFSLCLIIASVPLFGQNASSEATPKDRVVDLANEAYYLGRSGLMMDKKEKLDTAIAICNQNQIEACICSYSFRHLGNIYTRLGDFDRAMRLLNEASRIGKICGNSSMVDRSEHDINIIRKIFGEHSKALSSLRRQLKSQLKVDDQRGQSFTLNSIGESLYEIGQREQALDTFQLAMAMVPEDQGNLRAGILSNFGAIYFDEFTDSENPEALQKAKDYYQQALEEYIAFFGPKSREVGKARVELGQVYDAALEHEQALNLYQEVLTGLLPQFDPSEILDNPEAEDLRAENTLIDVLIAKSELLEQRHVTSNQQQDLEAALDCHLLMMEVEALLRPYYQYESSKLLMQEESHRRREAGIRIAYKLYESSPNTAYVEQALQLAENSKSVILLESLREMAGQSLHAIRKDWSIEERQIRERLPFLKRQAEQLEIAAAENSDLVERLRDVRTEMVDLETRQDELLSQIAGAYPEYFNYKYKKDTITLDRIRDQLLDSRRKGFIEFFVGDQASFAIIVTKREAAFVKLATFSNESEAQLQAFLQSIWNPTTGSIGRFDKYRELGYSLYQSLILPIEEEIDLPRRLIVVTDGLLSYLPFDALLAEASKSSVPGKLPFLFKKYMFSLAYSSSVLFQEHRPKTARSDYLGVAPVFADRPDLYLSNSEDEIRRSLSIFNGSTLLGPEATKAAFRDSASNYRIVHLSTHAVASDNNQLFPWIRFIDTVLYLPELYTWRLNSDLVIVSACEGNQGELRYGEGVMSIARGFSFTGCPSILSTLWSVNDASTADIIVRFNELLAKGYSKEEALHQAKAAFLEQLDRKDQAHPYYWAGLVIVGDTDPIFESQSRNTVWGWLLGMGALVGIIAVARRRFAHD